MNPMEETIHVVDDDIDNQQLDIISHQKVWKTKLGWFCEYSTESKTLVCPDVDVEIITLAEFDTCQEKFDTCQERENADVHYSAHCTNDGHSNGREGSNWSSGMYACEYCLQYYPTPNLLRRHINTSHSVHHAESIGSSEKPTIFRCHVCYQGFYQRSYVEQHCKQVHPEVQFRNGIVDSHSSSIIRNNNNRKDICSPNISTTSSNSSMNHSNLGKSKVCSTGNRNFLRKIPITFIRVKMKTSSCGQVSKARRYYRKRKRRLAGLYGCPVCPRYYQTVDRLRWHTQRNHPNYFCRLYSNCKKSDEVMSQVAANVQYRKGEIKGLGISENNTIKCRICHESVSFYEMRSHIVSNHCNPFKITMVDIADRGSFPCSNPVNVINSEINDVSCRQVNQPNDFGTSQPVQEAEVKFRFSTTGISINEFVNEEYVDTKDGFIEMRVSCSCSIDIVKQEPTISSKKSVFDFDDNEDEMSNIFETLASYQVEGLAKSNSHMKERKAAISSKSNLNVTEQEEQDLSQPAWSETPIDIPDVDEVLDSSDGTVTFKCQLCLFVSKHKKVTKNHMLNHFPPSFSCKMCERRCRRKQDILLHVKLGHPDISVPSGRVNGQKIAKCDRCNKVFYNQSALKNHVRKKICTKKNSRCNICGEVFYDQSTLRKHVKNKICTKKNSRCNEDPSKPAWSETPIDIPDVDEVLDSSDGTVTFKCQLCLFVSKHKKATEKHTLNHFPPAFSCNMCERRCQQKQDILRHVKLGHPDISGPSGRENGQKIVKCDRRNQIFSNQLTFKRHVEKKIFTKKNTRCNICGKNFFDPSSLRKHVKNKVCIKNNSRCSGTFSSADMQNHVEKDESSQVKTVLKTDTEDVGKSP